MTDLHERTLLGLARPAAPSTPAGRAHGIKAKMVNGPTPTGPERTGTGGVRTRMALWCCSVVTSIQDRHFRKGGTDGT